MTIAGIGGKIKRFIAQIPTDALIVASLFVIGTGCFGLGLLAGKDMAEGQGVTISQRPLVEAAVGGVITDIPEDPTLPAMAKGGQYVASKNGSAYYLPWCGGAGNIKEENKVWFASKEEAEAKGYRPAKNCKGI